MAMMNEMEYRTIGSALAGGYRAAVYCRLSKDDDLQGESASIANQKVLHDMYILPNVYISKIPEIAKQREGGKNNG